MASDQLGMVFGPSTLHPHRSVQNIVQQENKVWVAKNFGEHPSSHPYMGMMEELGELGAALLAGKKESDFGPIGALIAAQDQLGKIAHAYLKTTQKIRGNEAEHRVAASQALMELMDILSTFTTFTGIEAEGEERRFEDLYPDYAGGEFEQEAAIKDAIGDIQVYMADFGNQEGINIENCLHEAWQEVRERDWNKHREDANNGTGTSESA